MLKKITFFLKDFLAQPIFYSTCLLAGMFLCFNFASISEIKAGQDNNPRVNDEILVKLKNKDDVYCLNLADIDSYEKMLADLNKSKQVDYAEPNFLYQAALIPSDTYYANQWYLQKIKAPQAWDINRESKSIVIAIIDSGVQINHPDLADNIWINEKEIPSNGIDDDHNGFIDDINGWDFVNNEASPEPKFKEGYTEDGIWHGTIVAGIAAAAGNNAAGIAGVTWRSQIMPLKVLDDQGAGDTRNVMRAIEYAIVNGADIINFSFVGQGNSRSLEAAIRRAYEANIIIIAAAGNELDGNEGYFLDETPMYPACHDGGTGENMVIGVAATDALDQKAIFSSFGFKCVDLAAPGVSFFSTVVKAPIYNKDKITFNNYYDGYWSGTSLAAAVVSGAAALTAAVSPSLSRNQVVQLIIGEADNINRLNPDYIGQLGQGRLNLYKSVKQAKSLISTNKSYIIVAPQSDNAGTVKKINNKGKVFSEWLAYDKNFRGGVNVAAGDVDGDGRAEIITGAGFSGGPQVRVFKADGRVLGQFFAYDKNFRGGVNVAAGDVIGGARNSGEEIITAPGLTGGPHIRIFDDQGHVISQFFAYDKKFKGGVNITAGDLDQDGLAEIITGAGPGGTPHLRSFNKDGKLIDSLFVFSASFSGGIKLSAYPE